MTPSTPDGPKPADGELSCASTKSHEEEIFGQVSADTLCFGLSGQNVQVLSSPTSFYDQLVHNIAQATTRITLSSLYLGTGELETTLVRAMEKRLEAKPQLQVTVVLDFSRGQRLSGTGPLRSSSVTMLQPLLQRFPDRVRLFLYKVPQLKGWKASLPPPFNETLGVCHTKVYLVDDVVILSGANMSHDYFTNRQDRYVQVSECKGLSQFYEEFVKTVANFSFQVRLMDAKDKVSTSKKANDGPKPKCAYDLMLAERLTSHHAEETLALMKQELEQLVKPSSYSSVAGVHSDRAVPAFATSGEGNSATKESGNALQQDTWAFPTIQFSPIGVEHDRHKMTKLIGLLPENSHLFIASGYLNFPGFLNDLLVSSKMHLDVLTAAPIANGFYNARGIKGAIPMAYSLIEKDFYDQTQTRPAPLTSTLREFTRKDWTFHAKGMWWSPPERNGAQSLPVMSIFGSSNFGKRSYGFDLESQVFLYTRNAGLQQRFQQEVADLKQHSEVVTESVWSRPERLLNAMFCWKQGHWIRPVARLIAAYM